MNFGNKGYLVVAGLEREEGRLPSAEVEALKMHGDVPQSSSAAGPSWDFEGWSFLAPLAKELQEEE